ncbi:YggU family protein [Candidatus Falkowbacteria bacterium]|jgi:uncharacterized protein|nr:YggU family protein [Candidatus Falkowbacteria bacterium]MBT4433560.1 YggU family protein [Candidatus Falkowbacteria bacterium]
MLKDFKKELEKNNKIHLQIKVSTKKPKTEIKDLMENNTIKINLSSPPEKGKANKELIKFLSKEFSIKENNIQIISGKTDKLKLVRITDL